MGKDLPLFDYIEQLPVKKEQPALASKEKTKKKPRTQKLELIADGYTEEQIENLRVRVRRAMDWKPGMNWAFAQDQAFRKILKLPLFGKLRERHSKLLSLVASKSGSRSAEKNKAEREYKERHTVPEGKTFTPVQIARMSAQAQELEDEDTERAGQPLE